MAFTYNPKDANRAWPEGMYPAEIKDAGESISKSSNNEMLVISYMVYDDKEGREQELKDFITQKSLFKLKQLAKALGQLEDFEAGKFDATAWLHSRVNLHLIVEETDQYGDQNRIKSVLPAEKPFEKPTQKKSSRPAPVTQPAAIGEDDIPF